MVVLYNCLRLSPRDARFISFTRVLVVGQKLFLSVGSGGALPRWDCPTFVSRKTTTEKKDLSTALAAAFGSDLKVSR